MTHNENFEVEHILRLRETSVQHVLGSILHRNTVIFVDINLPLECLIIFLCVMFK